MKIAYVANHHQPRSNDDEGAITHCLRDMGHRVVTIQETDGRSVLRQEGLDLVLFHKWHDTKTLRRLKGTCKTAFWYFDLVKDPDDTASARCWARTAWMADVTPLVTVGFCTDGDWVVSSAAPNLTVLRQGFDERLDKPFRFCPSASRVLFTGNSSWSHSRTRFVASARQVFGNRLVHFERGLYRDDMVEAVRNSVAVLGAAVPGSDRYWSNRIYNTLGSGGFLLHPAWADLGEHYRAGEHYASYSSTEELEHKFHLYLEDPSSRALMAYDGYVRTRQVNLYRHRVEAMLARLEDAK